MTRHKKMLLAGVAVAAVGLGAVGAVARHGGHGWGHHGGGKHGGMFGGGFGHMGRLCKDGRAAEMADIMAVRIEHRAKPTDAQKPAFDELKTAMQSAAGKLQAGCPAKPTTEASGEGERKRPNPVERLANAEAMTAATLEAIKTLRPAAETFYAQLSDEQKAAISPERRRGGWWKRHGGRDGGKRGDGAERGSEDRGPDSGPDGGESTPDLP